MAEYKITLDSNLLHEAASRPDGYAELMQEVMNQLLDAQATEQIGAERYGRSELPPIFTRADLKNQLI